MAVEKYTASSSLSDVIERILDKGLIIYAWTSISLLGIRLLTIEALVIVSSVEKYLLYCDAIGVPKEPAYLSGIC